MSRDIKLTKLAGCAGCGAKVGAGTLAQLLGDLPVHRDENLLVGFDTNDDSSVYCLPDGTCVVQSLDFFPPIVDDPYTFGKIAAANALSDIFAMGAEPKLAMNILAVSPKMDDGDVHALLRGGYEKVYEAGAIITGGHTIFSEEPKYGLSVTGFSRPERILKNSAARVGDALILTKPLGIGILTTAQKGGVCDGALFQRAVEQMCALNKAARDIMVDFDVHGCTDVTGFGLLGHAFEMANGSDVTIELRYGHVPVLPGVLELAELGLLPEGMYRNRKFAAGGLLSMDGVTLAMEDVLFDPQTSGGLLIAAAGEDAERLRQRLAGAIPCAEIIGHVTQRQGAEIVLRP